MPLSLKVNQVRYNDITRSGKIQRRMDFVREAQGRGYYSNLVSPSSPAFEAAAKKVGSACSEKPGLYLCSGGDISTFVLSTGARSVVCVDQHPLLAPERALCGLRFDSRESEAALNQAAFERLCVGYWKNTIYAKCPETGIFMFYDLLTMHASEISVFQREDNARDYFIRFMYGGKVHQVLYCQKEVDKETVLGLFSIDTFGLVMLKAGCFNRSMNSTDSSYRALASAMGKIEDGTFVVTDRLLEGVSAFDLDIIRLQEIEEGVSFGYSDAVYVYSRQVLEQKDPQ